MDEAVMQFLTSVLTIAGTVIAVTNYLNNRFQKLSVELGNLVTEQAVDSAVIKQRLDHLDEHLEDVILFRINQNTELINHRTKRYETGIEDAKELAKERDGALRLVVHESRQIVLSKLERQDKILRDVQNFLASNSSFKVREG